MDGIKGDVNVDVGYKNFPTIIKAKGLNGWGKAADPTPAEPDATATVTVTVGNGTYQGTLVKE